MNKFAVALAAAGLTASLGAYAALPTDAPSFAVNIPNLTPGLQITLEGLLLQPTNSDLDYATISSLSSADFDDFPFFLNTKQDVENVNPHYNFGFRVGLGYTFPDSGNDVQLSWTHFDHSTTDNVGTDPGDVLRTGLGVPLFNFFDPDVITSNVGAQSTVKSRLDSIDLDVGQYVNLGTRLQTRFFGGLRFASVRQNVTNQYGADWFFTDAPGDSFAYGEKDEYNSKFNGVGPRFGVDTSYHISDCFGIAGHVAGALLIGEVKTNTSNNVFVSHSETDVEPPFTHEFDFDNDVTVDNSWRVVPVLDAKVGFNYTFLFDNKSNLTVELGWQATEYFDAVDQVKGNIADEPFEGNHTSTTTSNIGFQGPYLSLNYKM